MTLGAEVLEATCSAPAALLGPRLAHSFADEVSLELGAFVGVGDGPTFRTDTDRGTVLYPLSEFGLYPDTFFGSLRLYF